MTNNNTLAQYASQDLFNRYKDEAIAMRIRQWPNCDNTVIPLLNYLNTLNGVTTVHSCESHPEKNEFRFYVMCSVTGEGYQELNRFYRHAMSSNYNLLYQCEFKLEASYHYHIFDDSMSLEGPFPAYILSAVLPLEIIKVHFFRAITALIKEHKNLSREIKELA